MGKAIDFLRILRLHGDLRLNTINRDRLALHDCNRILDRVLVIFVNPVSTMRSGIEEVQAELAGEVVVGNRIRTVRLAVNGADKLRTIGRRQKHRPVSYTHLTLPTICSV